MVPLLVGFAYLGRRWIQVLSVVAVAGSASVAALGEWRRTEAVSEEWWVNAVVIAASLPAGVLVVVFLVRGAYARLQDQSAELVESRTPGRGGGRRRPAQPGARPARRRPAAAAGLERDHRAGPQGAEGRAARSAATLLDQLAADNREIVTELRELARGIYPPLLTERGLVAALQSTARRSAVPVTLDVADVERTDPQVEAAAYFCILEALTNAAKHSGATEVHVTLRGRPHLSFTVVTTAAGSTATRWTPGDCWGWRRGSPRPVAGSPSTPARDAGRSCAGSSRRSRRWTPQVNDR